MSGLRRVEPVFVIEFPFRLEMVVIVVCFTEGAREGGKKVLMRERLGLLFAW